MKMTTGKLEAIGEPVADSFNLDAFINFITLEDYSYGSGWGEASGSLVSYRSASDFVWFTGTPIRPLNRIRSSMNANTTITDYGIKPVDGSYSEVFLPSQAELDDTIQIDFIKIMRWPNASMKYFPIPQNLQDFAQAYIGETQLSKIDVFDSPRIVEKVDQISYASVVTNRFIDEDGETRVGLNYALDYYFSKCTEAYPWFSAELCPRFFTAAGDELFIDALFIPQSEDNKVSIKQVLDNILSLTKAQLIQNKDGNLEIIVFYGADAFNRPTITLKENDIVAPLFEPKADPRDFYNAAEISEKGLTFEVGQEVLKPAYITFAYDDSEDAEFTVPSGFTPIDTTTSESDGIEHIGIGMFYVGRTYTWPVLDDETLIGSDIIWVDAQITAHKKYSSTFATSDTFTTEYQTITLAANEAEGSTEIVTDAIAYDLPADRIIEFNNDRVILSGAESSGSTTLSVNALAVERVISDSGVTSQLPVFIISNFGQSAESRLTLTTAHGDSTSRLVLGFSYDSGQQAIIIKILEAVLLGDGFFSERTAFYYECQLRAYGSKYAVSSTENKASFGLNDTDELRYVDGTLTALANSRAAYGRKVLRVSSNYLSIGMEQLARLAEALVRQNINPAKLWRFNLTPRGMERGPDYDDIGQKLILPTLSETIVEGVNYSDEKTYTSLSMNEGIVARELFLYHDPATTGSQYYLDEVGNTYVDEFGNPYIDGTYVADDGTPTPVPGPANPTPVASSIEGYAGVDNDADWENATVTTVSSWAALKTAIVTDGTTVTPRIVRLTADIIGGGAGDFASDSLPLMGENVCLDLNHFDLLGGATEPVYEDNTVSGNFHPNGLIMNNNCRVINGRIGHFYDGLRLRSQYTGMSIENITFLYCQDEQIGTFAEVPGSPTCRFSLIQVTFTARRGGGDTNYNHPILIQSDSHNHNNTYVTIARCRFERGLHNRLPKLSNGGFLHMYNCVQYDASSNFGHIALDNGAHAYLENNVFYDDSSGNGRRITFTDTNGKATFSGNFFMNNAIRGLPNSTLGTFVPSNSYVYTLLTARADIEAEAGAR